LPIKQTKLSTDITGPITGSPQPGGHGCPVRNRHRQKMSGTQAPTPAVSRPMTMSRTTAAHSITNMRLTEVKPSRLSSRRQKGPPVHPAEGHSDPLNITQ